MNLSYPSIEAILLRKVVGWLTVPITRVALYYGIERLPFRNDY
ncbi:hypothetical protein [Staphylococcus epidermidis]|nr:hypothetical protein [Staphylococcus epidermidis]